MGTKKKEKGYPLSTVEFPNFLGKFKSGCDVRGCVSKSSS